MKVCARTAERPDLVSISSASIQSLAPITTPGAERVKQNFGAACKQQVVGRAFVGGGVVGLRLRLAEHEMRRVQPAEPVDARQDFVGDAVHHLADVAMHIGVEPAEIGHAAAVPIPPRNP